MFTKRTVCAALALVAAASVIIRGTTQTNPDWGLDRIDQRTGLDFSYSYSNTGAGVTVYVMDTGVRGTHSEFGGRVRYSPTFISPPTPENPKLPGTGSGGDMSSHGTFVASLIGGSTYGVAKGVNLVSVPVADDGGNVTTNDFVAAVNWIIGDHASVGGPAVLNVSLWFDRSISPGLADYQEEALRDAVSAGITLVTIAGNAGSNASGYTPARMPEAITVGATDSTDYRWGTSNYGSAVDLFAPGVGILGASDASDSAPQSGNGDVLGGTVRSGSGSSILAGQSERLADRRPKRNSWERLVRCT